ncbi:protein kinase [Candidatus Margulisiibacteriota bacterium]
MELDKIHIFKPRIPKRKQGKKKVPKPLHRRQSILNKIKKIRKNRKIKKINPRLNKILNRSDEKIKKLTIERKKKFLKKTTLLKKVKKVDHKQNFLNNINLIDFEVEESYLEKTEKRKKKKENKSYQRLIKQTEANEVLQSMINIQKISTSKKPELIKQVISIMQIKFPEINNFKELLTKYSQKYGPLINNPDIPYKILIMPDEGKCYALEKSINIGGEGEIYKAFSFDDKKEYKDSPVAIKDISFNSPQELKLLIESSKLHKKINGKPHILPLLNSTQHITKKFISKKKNKKIPKNGNYYKILPYAKYDLKKVIPILHKLELKNPDLAKKIKNTIFINMLKGLQNLHDDKISHLDFSTGNILFQQGFKISDFGLSQSNSSDTKGGTPYYSAPEVECPNIYKRDVFSFGVVMYELFNGKIPFKSHKNENMGYNWFANGTNIVKNFFTNKETPKELTSLENIILKCLDPNPDNRPSIKAILSTSFCKNLEIFSDPEKIENLIDTEMNIVKESKESLSFSKEDLSTSEVSESEEEFDFNKFGIKKNNYDPEEDDTDLEDFQSIFNT